jgi:hypothetical protein
MGQMNRIGVLLLGIVLSSTMGCSPTKKQDDVRIEIEPHLVIGSTTRDDVVVLMRERKYEVMDESHLPNIFYDRNCEYMPASWVEERLFGRYITVVDFCFDPKSKILQVYTINPTSGGPMFFP